MRIPLTPYGMPQVLLFPVAILAVMALLPIGLTFLPAWPIITIEVILALLLIWVLSFFRDPHRDIPPDRNLLVAPADGKVTDIAEVDHPALCGRALRIGIFLSVFNVHINRVPCRARIEEITYKKGKFKNALDPESARVNESNDLRMTRLDEPTDPLLVRQISGAIARRIVCKAAVGEEFTGGKQFGMIKFGSRTELILTQRENATCVVKVGDRVKAGQTILVRYENVDSGNGTSPKTETASPRKAAAP